MSITSKNNDYALFLSVILSLILDQISGSRPEVQRFIKRLRTFEYGILNHADYPIGTSGLEGANNKIKVIKRKAYGFQDSEYFALKVKQAFAA
jgi:transposase